MELISVTNNKTQLHSSPSDLSVLCCHENVEKRKVSSDISFFMSAVSPNCFAQIYKTDLLEIWRIKSTEDGKVFDRIRKTRVPDGVQAVACSKNKDSPPEYAIGKPTGQIKVVDLDSKNKYKAEFLPDPSNKFGVVSLDYSNCGGYLSSVYENGLINIYGLTTKIKSDSITLDRDSTLARFHPAKRFHLAAVSFKGSVTVYDIAAKKIHFQQKDAHDAPCRDVAMPDEIPDRLLTCGCDSVIKIFDTRKRATGLKIQSYCGFSTISVTKCGGFFAVGNLKGDVLTYDMRNLAQPLAAKLKVDKELVTRISFLPSWDNNVTAMSHRYSTTSTVNEDLPEPPEETSEMIDDIISFQKGQISELDISITSRVSTFSVSDRRSSENFALNMANALNDLSFTSDMSFVDENPDVDFKKVDNSKRFTPGKKDSINKRRSSFMPPALQLIQEEHGDKENVFINEIGTPNGGPRSSSTPATVIKVNHEKTTDASMETIDVEAIKSPVKEVAEKKQQSSEVTYSSPTMLPAQCNVDFKKEFEKLHDKIRNEIQMHEFDASARHWEMTFLVSNKTRQLQERVQMIEECMGILMNDDFKINRIMELESENQALRKNLDEVNRRSQY